jgi:3-dehydroquinate dehydratase II
MSSEAPVLVVLHGVNLDLLGERPAAHYGDLSLPQLEQVVRAAADRQGWRCVCHQTNHEGEFVELVHRYRRSAAALIVNPGAWTHYSYAIRDALELVSCPIAEVHLSDITAREPWRARSVIEDIAQIRVWGRGPRGYEDAVDELSRLRAPLD